MRRVVCLLITGSVVLSFLVGCAQATPTVAPTKPAGVAATIAPSAPTVAPKAPAAATAAPVIPTAIPTAKIKRGGIVRYSYFNDWKTGDIHLDGLDNHTQLVHHESLIEMQMNEATKRFELAPLLAESWEWPDPQTLVLKLHKGVKFHDGSSWNADTAKWNILRMRDHPKSTAKETVRGIKTVDVVDEYTVKLGLEAPSVVTLFRLCSSYASRPMMMSKAAMDKYGEEWHSNHYVGTGPFELTEWKAGDRQVFKRFDSYWRIGSDSKPMPYLDGVEARYIPDATVAMMEMRTGNLHLSDTTRPKDYPAVKSNPDLVMQSKFWDASGNTGFMNYTGGLYYQNLQLRQAVQYAIDRESMAKTLALEAGRGYYDIIPKGRLGYYEGQPRYTFDLEKAKSLVKDAGFPGGLDAGLLVMSRQPDMPQGEIIQSMLAKAGIRVKLDVMDKLAALDKIKANQYDMVGFVYGVDVDASLAFAKNFGCNGIPSWGNYCNKDFEACLDQADVERSEDKRGEILARCAKIIHDGAYFFTMWSEEKMDVYNKKLHGWAPYISYENFWHQLWLE
jgi:peptide/nickel transport system substrate-binding protein